MTTRQFSANSREERSRTVCLSGWEDKGSERGKFFQNVLFFSPDSSEFCIRENLKMEGSCTKAESNRQFDIRVRFIIFSAYDL